MIHNLQTVFTSKKQLKIPVKGFGFPAPQSGFSPFTKLQHTCKNSQSFTLSFPIFCQIDLTKVLKKIENRVTYVTPLKMALGKLGSGMAALGMLAVAHAPALAESSKHPTIEGIDPVVLQQIVDHYRGCIKEAAEAADENENGKLDTSSEKSDFGDVRELCDEEVTLKISTAKLRQRGEEADRRGEEADRRIAEATAKIIAGAKKEVGLN